MCVCMCMCMCVCVCVCACASTCMPTCVLAYALTIPQQLGDSKLAARALTLSQTIGAAIEKYGTVTHPGAHALAHGHVTRHTRTHTHLHAFSRACTHGRTPTLLYRIF